MTFRFIYDSHKKEDDDCEYYLEILDNRGKTWKLISVLDIESIEPDQGIKFVLSYYVTSSFFARSNETLKQEYY